ncbi:MAG: hypothetical protein K2W81_00090 [Sphingomonas sp.]|uniref:hypothetical protein n=1 Tax=Sphingomonas sp. TaxID=28214 RepID=UPI0025EC06CC|nr:hypothetical protein [Sphingomonas sp.]MBY0282339.1 hypothetical protein [Sphingomonas sp.]
MCDTSPRQAYTTFSKSGWGSGPWNSELDKAVWIDPATGLDCMYRRCSDGGYLCGYVAVEPGHPLYGFDHGAIPSSLGITAHTGLVESGLCAHGKESEAMCHVPAEGRPHDVWWFGFKCDEDCDHLPDGRRQRGGADRMGIYRSTTYVADQCTRLAAQLDEVARANAAPLAISSAVTADAPVRTMVPA